MGYLTASQLNFSLTKLKTFSVGLRSRWRDGILNCTAPILFRAFSAALEFWIGSPFWTTTFPLVFNKVFFYKFSKKFSTTFLVMPAIANPFTKGYSYKIACKFGIIPCFTSFEDQPNLWLFALCLKATYNFKSPQGRKRAHKADRQETCTFFQNV